MIQIFWPSLQGKSMPTCWLLTCFCLALGTELSQDDDAPLAMWRLWRFSILCHWKTCRILRFVPTTDFLRTCSCSVGQDDSEDEEPAPKIEWCWKWWWRGHGLWSLSLHCLSTSSLSSLSDSRIFFPECQEQNQPPNSAEGTLAGLESHSAP